MKNKYTILLLALLLVVSFGCSGNDTVESLTVSDLFPLQEGNYWKYNGYGNEYADFERKVLFAEDNRAQILETNPGTTMVVIYEIEDGRTKVVYSEENFFEEINILDTEAIMDQVILQEPIAVDQTWEDGVATYTILSLTEEVETDAGTFTDCVMIEVTYPGSTGMSFSFYKPGLGMVLQEYVDSENDYVISSVLSDFSVAGFQ